MGNAATIGKLSAKFGKGVGAALSFSDEALDLANAAKKGLSYLATKALPFLRAPGNLLSSQVRGFCDFARSIGGKLGATDEIYDLRGHGTWVLEENPEAGGNLGFDSSELDRAEWRIGGRRIEQ